MFRNEMCSLDSIVLKAALTGINRMLTAHRRLCWKLSMLELLRYVKLQLTEWKYLVSYNVITTDIASCYVRNVCSCILI